jgi:hypothetical protein
MVQRWPISGVNSQTGKREELPLSEDERSRRDKELAQTRSRGEAMNPLKFFLYARKSTDEEERQILSIESQVTELREFARKERLTIAQEFTESMSVKVPGRPVFNRMLELAEREGPIGFLTWHPDRLARNSVDGGRVVYLLDTGKLSALKFPAFWFENAP